MRVFLLVLLGVLGTLAAPAPFPTTPDELAKFGVIADAGSSGTVLSFFRNEAGTWKRLGEECSGKNRKVWDAFKLRVPSGTVGTTAFTVPATSQTSVMETADHATSLFLSLLVYCTDPEVAVSFPKTITDYTPNDAAGWQAFLKLIKWRVSATAGMREGSGGATLFGNLETAAQTAGYTLFRSVIISGAVEGYLGFQAGTANALAADASFNREKAVYIEQGGASLQIAFTCPVSVCQNQKGATTGAAVPPVTAAPVSTGAVPANTPPVTTPPVTGTTFLETRSTAKKLGKLFQRVVQESEAQGTFQYIEDTLATGGACLYSTSFMGLGKNLLTADVLRDAHGVDCMNPGATLTKANNVWSLDAPKDPSEWLGEMNTHLFKRITDNGGAYGVATEFKGPPLPAAVAPDSACVTRVKQCEAALKARTSGAAVEYRGTALTLKYDTRWKHIRDALAVCSTGDQAKDVFLINAGAYFFSIKTGFAAPIKATFTAVADKLFQVPAGEDNWKAYADANCAAPHDGVDTKFHFIEPALLRIFAQNIPLPVPVPDPVPAQWPKFLITKADWAANAPKYLLESVKFADKTGAENIGYKFEHTTTGADVTDPEDEYLAVQTA